MKCKNYLRCGDGNMFVGRVEVVLCELLVMEMVKLKVCECE